MLCLAFLNELLHQYGVEVVALLRSNGRPSCSDGSIQFICIVGSGVPFLPLDPNDSGLVTSHAQ